MRAALAIQAAIATYADEVRGAYGIELAVRVAVNSGPVVLTDDEADDAERYNALGDTVNVAARLQALDAEGGIVVGPETARQLQACFELEPLGEVELQGRGAARARLPRDRRARPGAHPAAACRWSGARPSSPCWTRPARRSPRAAARSSPSPASRASARRGCWPRRAGGRGDRVCFLEGRATSYSQGFPYWPVRDLLRDWLGIAADAPEARVRLELKAALGGLLGRGATSAYPFLARLLGVPLGRRGGRGAARAQPRGRADADVRGGARRRALASPTSSPLCLAIDDLQWADSATLELLEELLALTEETQLGVVLLYRADRDAASWRLGERARAALPAPLPRARAAAARHRREPRAGRRAGRGGAAGARSSSCWPSARAATRSSSRRRCRT